MVQYLELYRQSIEDPAGFWSDIASEFYWKQKWGTPVCSENFDVRKGRINIEGTVKRLLSFGKETTYNQLLQKVCQLANYLKDVGIRKDDVVLIYLPMLMEMPIAMLVVLVLVLFTREET
ncbi:hypothetical protein ACS0TY_017511 [Phlomoides rotata]